VRDHEFHVGIACQVTRIEQARNRDFRGFIFYSCFWNLAAMVGAPFISIRP
jgi:hypothetical protein